MTAIEIERPGGPEVLRAVERPVPEPGPGEVLVQVEAAGVNRPDLMQRLGKYPPPAGSVGHPGSRDCRERSCPSRTARAGGTWAIESARSFRAGGYAEYRAAPAVQCLPIPEGLNAIAAGAIPETFFTVWTNVFERGRLAAGERLLVHGGASGIGTTAIQLAHAFGAIVFATAGTDDKCEACRSLGAAVAINYRTQDFAEVVRRLKPQRQASTSSSTSLGADYFARNIECLARHGRLVQIGLMSGPKRRDQPDDRHAIAA